MRLEREPSLNPPDEDYWEDETGKHCYHNQVYSRYGGTACVICGEILEEPDEGYDPFEDR